MNHAFRSPFLALALSLPVAACNGGGGGGESSTAESSSSGETPQGTTETPPSATTTSGVDGTSTTAPEDPSTSGTTASVQGDVPPPISFDFPPLPDAPPLDESCGEVDFLFAIDNSGSMSAQQTQLLNSFQGFIDAIQASLEDTVDSYHVAVVTSDNYFNNAPGCQTIGDVVSQTGGFQALGQVCTPFAEGNRFATEQDDLEEVFPCMAQVGTSGSPISAFCPGGRSVSRMERCDGTFYSPDATYQMFLLSRCPDPGCPVSPTHVSWSAVECCN